MKDAGSRTGTGRRGRAAGAVRRPLQVALVAAAVLGLHVAVLSAWSEPPPLRAGGEKHPALQVLAPAITLAGVATALPVPKPVDSAGPRSPARVADVREATPTPATGPAARLPALAPMAENSSAAHPPSSPAAALATGPVRVPPPMRLRYAVTAQTRGLTLGGEATLDWRPAGAAYQADLEMRLRPVGSRSQHSEGQLTPRGLVPLKFIDRSRHEEASHFDPAAGRIVFSANKPEAALMPGVQDRLSLVIQLAALVAGQPERFRAGARLEIQTATTREADLWHLRVEGEQELALPGGAVRALRLVREPRQPYDSVLEIWLAPGQHYAPVRLRLTQPGGDWVDQAWVGTDRP